MSKFESEQSQESDLFQGVSDDGSVSESTWSVRYVGKVVQTLPVFDLWVTVAQNGRGVHIFQSAWLLSDSKVDNFGYDWSVYCLKDKIDDLIALLQEAKKRL